MGLLYAKHIKLRSLKWLRYSIYKMIEKINMRKRDRNGTKKTQETSAVNH